MIQDTVNIKRICKLENSPASYC